MAWYENPTIAAVLGGLAGTLLSALAAIYVWRRTHRIRRVDCVVTDVASLLTFSDRIRDELRVTFAGSPANAVYLMSLDVVNTGTEAVRSQPINIRLAEGARIVDYSYKTEPPVGFGDIYEVKRDGSALDLEVALLNPGDRVSIELVSIDNPDDTLDVYLKNANVQTRMYSRASAESTVFDLMNDTHVMWLAVLGAMPLFGGIARSLIDVAVAKRIGKLSDNRGLLSNNKLQRTGEDAGR